MLSITTTSPPIITLNQSQKSFGRFSCSNTQDNFTKSVDSLSPIHFGEQKELPAKKVNILIIDNDPEDIEWRT